MDQSKKYAAALAAERRGYVVTGRDDRVQAVDVELARAGFRVDGDGNLAPAEARAVRKERVVTRAPERAAEV